MNRQGLIFPEMPTIASKSKDFTRVISLNINIRSLSLSLHVVHLKMVLIRLSVEKNLSLLAAAIGRVMKLRVCGPELPILRH